MTSMALVVGLVLIAGAVLFSMMPLGGPSRPRPWDSKRQVLQAEKERLYTEIQDLEFDFKTGKLSVKDYEIVRGELVGEAAGVLEKLEGQRAKKDLDDEIESWISEARGRQGDKESG